MNSKDIALERIISLLPRKEAGSFVFGAKAEFCRVVGISQQTFSDWLSGRSRSYMDKLYDIASAYSVSVEWLKGDTDVKTVDFPEVTMIGRASKKMSPADREKMLQLIRIAFPEAFDD